MMTAPWRRAPLGWLDTLLPPTCPGCDEEIRSGRWICTSCRSRLRPVPERPLCLLCRGERRKREGREAGLHCSVPHHANLSGWAGYWMEPPLDAIIHRMKYAGCPALARPLARCLARRVGPPRTDGVLPVPLHVARIRERGYNQAELLARELADCWRSPLVPGVLRRVRATRAQAKLSEEKREKNVRGAIQVQEPSWVQGRSWLVIDDVVTTGATLAVSQAALQDAGATRVIPVALALA